MAHLFVRPVLLSFTGMNLIQPYKISETMKDEVPTKIASKGRMVETPRRNKNESTNTMGVTKRQAHNVCTPIEIFANARFSPCKTSTHPNLPRMKRITYVR